MILYGEPGTGKTLLAKAVANSTSATFLRVVGSELIQKYLGDGPKLVRELFRVADELAPTIVFIGAPPAPSRALGDTHFLDTFDAMLHALHDCLTGSLQTTPAWTPLMRPCTPCRTALRRMPPTGISHQACFCPICCLKLLSHTSPPWWHCMEAH